VWCKKWGFQFWESFLEEWGFGIWEVLIFILNVVMMGFGVFGGFCWKWKDMDYRFWLWDLVYDIFIR
jgi:hypothetical protein